MSSVAITIPDALGKPRQTRADKWKQRPAVMRYRAFADLARLCAGRRLDKLRPDHVDLAFTFEMPKSWSKKKRSEMLGQPHRQKPDLDNAAKAVLDSLWEDDSAIWKLTATKHWGPADQTVVTVTEV